MVPDMFTWKFGGREIFMINSTQSFVHDLLTTMSSEATFLHDFLVILEEMFVLYYMSVCVNNVCMS